MNIDLQQLAINVNLHSLQPNFLNSELHYIIASDEQNFRFCSWDDQPTANESKFYCFLVERELNIPAGNVTVKESYSLETNPIYPLIENAADFISILENMEDKGATKAIRHFKNEAIDSIQRALEEKYGQVEKHMVKSPEWQHLLFILSHVEISIAASMVYFKQKVQFTEQHYDHLKQESAT